MSEDRARVAAAYKKLRRDSPQLARLLFRRYRQAQNCRRLRDEMSGLTDIMWGGTVPDGIGLDTLLKNAPTGK